ncbi:hypothetical protein GCM10009765_74890 [Fodinicola feengrottensis]|uniref:Rho termination factor N-terminal domain-containing protein n=1 Tax=Fodinicola feengrottensis TaxID=435914 RepID=A0ABN2IZM2_9ACTN
MYEFLARQDESTLQAIVSGTVQLAVAPADEAPVGSRENTGEPAPVHHRIEPSDDPAQAARDLARLTSENDRRAYVTASKLPMGDLRLIARLRGLSGYSRLNKTALVELLAGNGAAPARTPAAEPKTPAPSSAGPVKSSAPPPLPTKPDAAAAAIAVRLRETETEEAGAAYLRAQALDRDHLLAVAAELGLSRVNRLSQPELEKRVLKQAIGARRKFDGLRKW